MRLRRPGRQPGRLLDRSRRQQGVDLPRSGDPVPEPDSAAAAAEAAGDSRADHPDGGRPTGRAGGGGGIRPATIAVMNLYDSDFVWPEGSRIDSLRVIQVLPKSTPPPNEPRIGVAEQTNARAVLGTVPVEPDGSVYFETPAGVPIYFQAIDARGMAVQSMRSVTYLHPGEQLTCQGCHERKHRPPSRPEMENLPLALRRPPSKIVADVAALESVQLSAARATGARSPLRRLPPAEEGRSIWPA